MIGMCIIKHELFFRDASDLTSDLTIRQSYLLQFDAKVGAGDSVVFRVNDGIGTAYTSALLTDSFVTYNVIFTALHVNQARIYFDSMGAGEEVWIRNMTLTELGGGTFGMNGLWL